MGEMRYQLTLIQVGRAIVPDRISSRGEMLKTRVARGAHAQVQGDRYPEAMQRMIDC